MNPQERHERHEQHMSPVSKQSTSTSIKYKLSHKPHLCGPRRGARSTQRPAEKTIFEYFVVMQLFARLRYYLSELPWSRRQARQLPMEMYCPNDSDLWASAALTGSSLLLAWGFSYVFGTCIYVLCRCTKAS